jgi:hypothetical protein
MKFDIADIDDDFCLGVGKERKRPFFSKGFSL